MWTLTRKLNYNRFLLMELQCGHSVLFCEPQTSRCLSGSRNHGRKRLTQNATKQILLTLAAHTYYLTETVSVQENSPFESTFLALFSTGRLQYFTTLNYKTLLTARVDLHLPKKPIIQFHTTKIIIIQFHTSSLSKKCLS